MHISQRSESAMIRNIDNSYNAKRLAAFGKKYPVDLGEGKIVFLDKPMTANEYRAAEQAETMARIEAGRERRQQKAWNQAAQALKPVSVRKPIFDRHAGNVLATDKLSQMLAAAMKGGSVMSRLEREEMMYLLEQKHAKLENDHRDQDQVFILWMYFRKGGL